MTNEKRYEHILEMVRAYDVANKSELAEKLIAAPTNYIGWTAVPFYADAAALLLDAKEEMDKKNSGAGRTAAIKRVYKSTLGSRRDSLMGVFKCGDRWAICDGYRAIRMNEKPESIPECKGGIDLDKAIRQDMVEQPAVELPTVAEIKAFMVEHKPSRRGAAYPPIEAVPGWWCNPQYLLDMVQALPGGTAHKPLSRLAAMYYESADGDAILMPVGMNRK